MNTPSGFAWPASKQASQERASEWRLRDLARLASLSQIAHRLGVALLHI